ncbi:ferredoxin [Alteribacillus sp. YIM 98480]|uniref:ferredoxin n=1 Tax=Alteribacillus sp. YIM 98480 TaxID=2606599 RepID=UPI00131BE47F|nr:ferredoxin [Alteribacillus sp. YIM 98480]
MRVWIDKEKCVGSATCTIIAPNVFDINEDGQAVVANNEAEGINDINKSADNCPVQAIVIEKK